jgi:hypothetical protein
MAVQVEPIQVAVVAEFLSIILQVVKLVLLDKVDLAS